MKLSEKTKIVEDLRERFARAAIVVLTDYKGLDVAAITELRSKLRESEIEFRVVKNTLLVRAAEGTDIAPLKDHFKGPSAIALSYQDPVGPAKVLVQFAETNQKLEIKAGALKGRILDFQAIKALSTLPSRDALLGQFLSVLNGVPTGLVRALNDVPRRMVNVLQAIKDQKEAA